MKPRTVWSISFPNGAVRNQSRERAAVPCRIPVSAPVVLPELSGFSMGFQLKTLFKQRLNHERKRVRRRDIECGRTWRHGALRGLRFNIPAVTVQPVRTTNELLVIPICKLNVETDYRAGNSFQGNALHHQKAGIPRKCLSVLKHAVGLALALQIQRK